MNILKLEENNLGNDYVVGDIHGTFWKLVLLLKKINFNYDKDRLFSVGDLIDRGKESYKMVEYLEQSWFYAIIGNHEEMLIDAVNNNSLNQNHHHRYNSRWFYNLNSDKQNNIIYAIKKLPYIILIGDNAVIHAEVPKHMNDFNDFLNAFDNPDTFDDVKYSCVWGTDRIGNGLKDNIVNISKIFCGHTVLESVTHRGNIIYCDTGGVFGDGRLSAVNIKTLETWSI